MQNIIVASSISSILYIQCISGWSLNPLSWFWFSKGCKLNLRLDINHGHEPVFLTKKWHGLAGYELALPQMVEDTSVFKLSRGEHIYVACPGNNNELKGFDSGRGKAMASTCVKDNILSMMGKDVSSLGLECKTNAFANLKETGKKCGNFLGNEIQLGFEVEGWHPLVTLCFLPERAETLHATHILYGSTLKGAEVKNKKNYYIKGPRQIYSGVNPAVSYKQANQRDVLSNILGENKANYVLARSYLSRSHLAPDGDFLLGAWQHLTYFYVNTAPQWQCINGGNWHKLENIIRTFAISAKQDYVVTTGTYGILELEDQNGALKEIYLDPLEKKIPVPSLFWKIVADPANKACIVFLTNNNPFLTKTPQTICKDICSDFGWPSDMNDIFRGFTYCCSYIDLKRVVGFIPDLDCDNVLENVFN